MLKAQAASNNGYLDADPAALSRQEWVEASIQRFGLTIAAWPDSERVAAWRNMMLACDQALASNEPPPIDHDPYAGEDEGEPTLIFPENF